jgi:hypothetical protein
MGLSGAIEKVDCDDCERAKSAAAEDQGRLSDSQHDHGQRCFPQVGSSWLRACRRSSILVGLFLLLSLELSAEQDAAAWLVTNVSTQLGQRASANLEIQHRFIDNASDFSQRLIRPSVTYRLNDTFTVTAGYAHILTDLDGRQPFSENRPWQQLGYSIYGNDYGLNVSGRTRLEQRFVELGDDVGWRVRQMLRVELPFQEKGQTKGVLWNETFVGLNSTSWGQRNDLDQSRTFLGVMTPVTENIQVEAGYLNQWINRPGEDLINHAFATYLNFRI